jgi:hypothetical protein
MAPAAGGRGIRDTVAGNVRGSIDAGNSTSVRLLACGATRPYEPEPSMPMAPVPAVPPVRRHRTGGPAWISGAFADRNNQLEYLIR